ncbi:MAG: hypothetical protein HC849_03260 [Oscillatoriales cyanobacterium RU_3_3]|nr:hypothetical protein [Oscillatoriales cyanobacterium RU_3_3]
MLIQSIGHASRCSYRNDKYGFSNRLLSQKKYILVVKQVILLKQLLPARSKLVSMLVKWRSEDLVVAIFQPKTDYYEEFLAG